MLFGPATLDGTTDGRGSVSEWTVRERALDPAIPLAVMWTAGPLAAALPAVGLAESLCAAEDLLGESDIERIRGAGLGCHVWTVNEPALTNRLVG